MSLAKRTLLYIYLSNFGGFTYIVSHQNVFWFQLKYRIS